MYVSMCVRSCVDFVILQCKCKCWISYR